MLEAVERTMTDNPMSDEERWEAFEARDAGYDGRFVVGVRSTGIYCRPSCPARRPLRRNVVFYPLGEAAEREGYRPCRRCKPEEVLPQARAVEQACRYIEKHLDRNVTLDELGEAVAVSPQHLQRTFKRVMGSRRVSTPTRVGWEPSRRACASVTMSRPRCTTPATAPAAASTSALRGSSG